MAPLQHGGQDTSRVEERTVIREEERT